MQCNQTSGPTEVAWNRVTNFFGESGPEDVISLAAAQGTSGSGRINVHHNLINGCYPLTVGEAGFSGSGILADENTRWAWMHDNVTVACCNLGIGIAGESNCLIEDNRMVLLAAIPS